MTQYERELYKAEIRRLTEEVKRLSVLLELWKEAAKMDYATTEVPSGPQA